MGDKVTAMVARLLDLRPSKVCPGGVAGFKPANMSIFFTLLASQAMSNLNGDSEGMVVTFEFYESMITGLRLAILRNEIQFCEMFISEMKSRNELLTWAKFELPEHILHDTRVIGAIRRSCAF